MAKFKIGDRVRVLDGSNIENYTGGWAESRMKPCVGKEFIVKKVRDEYGGRIAYELEPDQSCNVFHTLDYLHWDERGLEKVYTTTELGQALSDAIRSARAATVRFYYENVEEHKMKNVRFSITDGVRYVSEGKHKGKTVPTITTTVYDDVLGAKGTATCDKDGYDERQGILEAVANMVYGNFDREYVKFKNKKKKIEEALCKCSMCGKTFKTKEEARACEDAHIERKAAKRDKYRMRKAAEKRAREMQIEQMAKEILRKESHERC